MVGFALYTIRFLYTLLGVLEINLTLNLYTIYMDSSACCYTTNDTPYYEQML